MNEARENLRTIVTVEAEPPARLKLGWSNGVETVIDLGETLDRPAFKSLRSPEVFRQAAVGDWGHSVAWPDEVELGADRLWLDTLAAIGKEDAREFLEWRLRNGLSLSKAAHVLDMSRRMIAYYSHGEKPVPKHILLACKGWEALQDEVAAKRAAA